MQTGNTPPTDPPGRIRHIVPAMGRPTADRDTEPLPIAESLGPTGKIRAISDRRRHEDLWSRTPNTTGQGAIHVRTFSAKLTEDALKYMDQSINEWLDAHPQYEVKFSAATVGILTGKLKEPYLICQVWV